MKIKNISILNVFPEISGMVEILKWHKAEGDQISRGNPLIEIIANKEVFEINSPCSGILAKINANKNEIVSPESIIAIIKEKHKK